MLRSTLLALLLALAAACAGPRPDVHAEIQIAHESWVDLRHAARRQGIAVDAPGPHLDRVRIVFGLLVGVARRQSLPWEVHLVDARTVNAVSLGGGVVVVFDGLFGDVIPPRDDEALAAVLAHEIAHVEMLHANARMTWSRLGALVSDRTKDPRYPPAHGPKQEAEADRLSVLYLALAGFDPMAAPRIFERAQEKEGSSGARSRFLHDHPHGAARIRAMLRAARQAQQHWTPGERNPSWREILASGARDLRVPRLARDAQPRQESIEVEPRGPDPLAEELARVRIVRSREEWTADGTIGVFLEVYNGASRDVGGLAVVMRYVNGERVVARDGSCRLPVRIRAGETVEVGCHKGFVAGANAVVPEIVAVRWR